MRALISSIIVALIVGLMTWRKDPVYPLFLVFLTLIIVSRNLKTVLRGYLLFMPLIFGLSWFNGFISFTHGGSFFSTFTMVFARLLTLINLSAFFVFTIEPYELAENFAKISSPSIGYVFYIAYNMMQTMIKRYQDTYQAMKSRLLLKSRLNTLRLIIPITISVVNYVYEYSEILGTSMEVRGFDDKRIFWRNIKLTKKDLIVIILLTTLSIIGFFTLPSAIKPL
ncbi:MAG: energy-coupling factor transporter transmembrane component T family protein [Thermoprotei archaeon]|jgi:energy-coupling factor transporter transmembrane protein EcfT